MSGDTVAGHIHPVEAVPRALCGAKPSIPSNARRRRKKVERPALRPFRASFSNATWGTSTPWSECRRAAGQCLSRVADASTPRRSNAPTLQCARLDAWSPRPWSGPTERTPDPAAALSTSSKRTGSANALCSRADMAADGRAKAPCPAWTFSVGAAVGAARKETARLSLHALHASSVTAAMHKESKTVSKTRSVVTMGPYALFAGGRCCHGERGAVVKPASRGSPVRPAWPRPVYNA